MKASPKAPKFRTDTVLLVGEHALLRSFLSAWLERYAKLAVVAEASSAKEALELVQKHKPALVLMDFDTLMSANLDFLTQLRLQFQKLKVIIYFAYANDSFALKAIRAGADGFVVKSAASGDMETAIKTVMAGGTYLSTEFLKSLGAAPTEEGVAGTDGKALSPRQGEILKLIALGLSTKAAAYELKISAKTVDVHKQVLMTRLGVQSVTELVKYAIRTGLVPA